MNKKEYIKNILLGIVIAFVIITFVVVYVNTRMIDVNSKVYVRYEASNVVVNDETGTTFVDAVNNARQSVVEINAAFSNGTSAGSGVIYGTDGNVTYIITNFHVIENATQFKVILYNGTTIEDVQLIGGDEQEDIAVLMIKGSSYKVAVLKEITAENPIKLGETVFAIGNPLGKLGGSVTKGIISCLNREISIDNKVMNLMQTDVSINSGNSGGGLFDANGNLIGIVNAKVSATGVEGIAFAISIDNAIKIANELIETHSHDLSTLKVTSMGYIAGRVDLGYEASYTSLIQGFYIIGPALFVSSVDKLSNAYSSGLRQYDRITSITYNNETITMDSQTKYDNILKEINVGDEITLTILRDSTLSNITIKASQKVYSI